MTDEMTYYAKLNELSNLNCIAPAYRDACRAGAIALSVIVELNKIKAIEKED